MNKTTGLIAGAATTNITPLTPQFLFGYPHVERISEGVNDWLLSSALYFSNGDGQVMMISNDVIFVNKTSTARIRETITKKTGIPEANITISATHTHSGPITIDCVHNIKDPVVPKSDPGYVRYLEDRIIEAGCNAFHNAVPAKAGFLIADGSGIGTNRHDPDGSADLNIPSIVLKDSNDEYIACVLVCNMHPTVLHEDSKLFSSDFPGYAREILQKQYFSSECPVIYFTGAAGNQSPRHVTKENTFAEASRLGRIIADAVMKEIKKGIKYSSKITISSFQKLIELPRRKFPEVEWAEKHLQEFKARFEHLKKTSENTQEIRTAEVDWFGAEELLILSELSKKGELEKYYKSCLPAEIQIIKIGHWNIVTWPGEVFVEYAIHLKQADKNAFLVTLANGELQGYIATKEAEEKGYYESSNSIFPYLAGEVLLKETLRFLKKIK